MDRITLSMLNDFCSEYGIENLDQSEQFEYFSTFVALRRHFSKAVDLSQLVLGQGGDSSADGAVLIVNSAVVTEKGQVDEIAEHAHELDATFIFIQADRGKSFDGKKISDFGYGVSDLFNNNPKNVRSEDAQDFSELIGELFAHAGKLRRPVCHMYYVTTGIWNDDQNLSNRQKAIIEDFKQSNLFEKTTLTFFGARELQDGFSQTKNAVSRTFRFSNRADLPKAAGVDQAYIGSIPFSEFRKIIADESGDEILTGVFEDNVRDWQDYNPVNSRIRDTLLSQNKNQFAFLNNGVTIVSKEIRPLGSDFTIKDYQIVNGCQSSNVLFDNRNEIDDTVSIPLRLIETKDLEITDAIIVATNSQTSVKPEQYISRQSFSRSIERFFDSFENEKLFYERRDGQFDRTNAPRSRIVSPSTLIRSFAAIYREEPHRTTRGYAGLRAQVGDEIMSAEHRLTAYYIAAYIYYIIDQKFNSKSIDRKYKPARYHLLLAVKLLIDPSKTTDFRANASERQALKMIPILHDTKKMDKIIDKAISIVDLATGQDFDRDQVRTVTVTSKILAQFR